MARYTDADAIDALEDLKYNFHPKPDGDSWYRACDVWDAIEAAPTIDAVEVVRCKDCKHCRITEFGVRRCMAWNRYNGFGDEGFCCYGERRGEDDD